MSIFDFDFVKHPVYSKIKYILWTITAVAWIADMFILKYFLISDIAIGSQFIIQIVLNAFFVALPMTIFAFYTIVRLHMLSKKKSP